MKRTFYQMAIVPVLAAGVALMSVAAVHGDEHLTPANQVTAGEVDPVTSGTNVRASQLIGLNIYNAKQESIGKVNDIVIDSRSGKVSYAAVSYGGLLGIGDKLFAVPWSAFECRPDQDGDGYHLTLDVTEQQMKTAVGFDQNHWPSAADQGFMTKLNKHYGVQEPRASQNDRVGDYDLE